MSKILFIIMFSVLAYFFVPAVFSVDLDGDYTENFSITQAAFVREGDEATIHAGVTVTFTGPYSITVEASATLTAEGEVDNSVTFTRTNGGNWSQILFDGDDEDGDATGEFDYCLFKNGGTTEASLWDISGVLECLPYSTLDVQNCTFENNDGSATGMAALGDMAIIFNNNTVYNCQNGVKLYNQENYAGMVPEIKNNVFIGCDYGIAFLSDSTDIEIKNNLIINSGINGVRLYWPCIFMNNTIVHSQETAVYASSPIGVFKNNIIYGYSEGVGDWYGLDAGDTISHCLIYDPVLDGTRDVTAFVTASDTLDRLPYFAWDNSAADEPGEYNYHLAFYSPSLHAGDSAGVGNNWNGTDTDMGAFGGEEIDSLDYYVAISDTIHTSVDFDADDGPFRLIGTAKVLADSSLLIEPDDENLIILAHEDAQLSAVGNLTIIGTSQDSVIFTRLDGDTEWSGIVATGLAITSDSLFLEYVDIKFADVCLTIKDNAEAEVKKSTISKASIMGVLLDDNTDQINFTDVTISDCGDYGIQVIETNLDWEGGSVTGCDLGGFDFLDCTNGTVEDCDIDFNHVGIHLLTSSVLIRDCHIDSNDENGIVSLSSNTLIGVANARNGNTIRDNGSDGDYNYECAELLIHMGSPSFADRYNDFIDNNDDITDDTLLIYVGNGTSGTFACSLNYFDGPGNFAYNAKWFEPLAKFDTTYARWQGLADSAGTRFTASFDALARAEMLEISGNYEDAADIYLELVEYDQVPLALSGWVRCQSALGTDEETIIEELEEWLDDESLGETAFWSRITVQNRVHDFDISIAQLDTFITEADIPADSAIGLLVQLNTYYQMYLAGYGGEEYLKAPPGGVERDDMDIFALPQLGLFEDVVPISRNDYTEKRSSYMHLLNTGSSELAKDKDLPVDFALESPYPNPFNPTVVVPFTVPAVSDIRLTVHDILGREVIRLIDGKSEVGRHKVVWNGTDSNGIQVSSGVYLINMKAGDYSATRKAVLVK